VIGPFTGVVLTGGASTRMGRDKALIEIGGMALAQRVAAALAGAGATEVLAIGGDRDALRTFADVDRWVADANPGEGPLDGVIGALRAATTDEVVILACDTPMIDASVPASLLASLRDDADVAVAVAVVEGREQPLTAAWRRSRSLAILERAFERGERAPRRVFPELRVIHVHGIPVRAVADVDRPDDLDRYAGPVNTAEGRGPISGDDA
jgi:molybdopterin-guanine dinucleotide biosynthesis protein A